MPRNFRFSLLHLTRIPIMKNPLLFAVFFAVGVVAPVQAQFTDTFSATVADRWGTPANTPLGPPDIGASSLSLLQDNGNSRVDWSATLGGASNSANRFLPLESHVGSFGTDWTVALDVVNTFSPASGQSTQIGLFAANTDGSSSSLTADYIKLVLVQANTGTPLAGSNVIHYGNHSNANSNPFDYSTNVGSVENLKLSYSAAGKTIAVYNGTDLIKTFGIDGVSGDTAYDWGMSSGSTFTVGIYAQSTTTASGTGFTIPAGVAYADTFTATGLTAIPEPGTYAALAGLAALGLAAWRRQRRGFGRPVA